ncbi:beta-sarcoglycan-like [Plakobranchus ocellatus]|uniref:Beta-sarcoglycan n=1 Tax=Plakobranchus ocellatus TaxID=259542 RepID=A0AAV3YA78_9GAST|nr:beta-sarcoglycan-like [Plakobranchus ocellatus]
MSAMNSEFPTNGAAGASTFDRRLDPRSPLSLGGTLGASTLSMRAKAARKRRINARHNSNFHAGFVPVDEELLQRSGIRGRKRYFLYCVIGSLLGITFLNLAVTAWLLYILGMTHYGLLSFELLSLGGRDFLRVLTDANIHTISMDGAPLGARVNSPMNILAEGSEIYVKTSANKSTSSLKMEDSTLTLTAKDLCIKSKNSSHALSALLASMASENIINNFAVDDNITVGKLFEGNAYADLYIESTKSNTTISGHEDVIMTTGKKINISASSIWLKSETAININSSQGIYFNSLTHTVSSRKRKSKSQWTFKICVCQTGRVFVVKTRKRTKLSCDIGKPKLEKICGSKTGKK